MEILVIDLIFYFVFILIFVFQIIMFFQNKKILKKISLLEEEVEYCGEVKLREIAIFCNEFSAKTEQIEKDFHQKYWEIQRSLDDLYFLIPSDIKNSPRRGRPPKMIE